MRSANKKKSKKDSVLVSQRKVNSTKKSSTSHKSENEQFSDVDSLAILNNAKERKKLDGIDERIKLLKTELKSLLGDIQTDGNDCSSDTNTFLNTDAEESKCSETNVKSTEDLGNLNESQTNASSCFSQENVERLLYKSFLMQNSDEHLNTSETSGAELNRCTRKIKQQTEGKPKGRLKKFTRGRPTQSNFSPCRSSTRRGVKRRLLDSSAPDSDIEVINLDTSSESNKVIKTNTACVDLDVSNYDWSEPFDINEETEFHPGAQIEQDSGTENDNTTCRELNLNCTKESDFDKSVFSSDCEKIQPKKVWECPICFERSKGQEIVATQCGHVFCKKCLVDHFSKLTENCPSCRSDLKSKPFITLYNF